MDTILNLKNKFLLISKQGGKSPLFKSGRKMAVTIFLAYLIRDLILYVAIPYLFATYW